MAYIDIEKTKEYKKESNRYSKFVGPGLIGLFVLIVMGIAVFIYMDKRSKEVLDEPYIEPSTEVLPKTKEEVLESMSGVPKELPDPYKDLTEEKEVLLEGMSASEDSYEPERELSEEEKKKILEGMSGQ